MSGEWDWGSPVPTEAYAVDTYGRHSVANVTDRVVNQQDVSLLRIVPQGVSVAFRPVEGGVEVYERGKHLCLRYDGYAPKELTRECGRTRPHMVWHGDEFGYILCATG